MGTEKRQDWRELCKAVSLEQNPKRLMALISELIATLDEQRASAPTDSNSLAVGT
jgi:hypothetical protein